MTALKNQGLKRGVAALCIGGGEATAVAITGVVTLTAWQAKVFNEYSL